MSVLSESLQSAYFQRSLMEAALVGVLGGVVGVHVILRRLPFFVAALSHATFPGAVVGSIFGIGIATGAGAAGIAVAVVVGILGSTRIVDHASVIGVVLAGAFALGVVILTASDGHGQDLASFLFGSILTITTTDVLLTALVSIAMIAMLAVLAKQLLFFAFDSTAYQSLGYSRLRIEIGLLSVIALTVAVMIPAVGTLLSLALLTVPSATARLWFSGLPAMTWASVAFGVLSATGGVLLSAMLDMAAGGAIAMLAGVLFLASVVCQSVRRVTTVIEPSP